MAPAWTTWTTQIHMAMIVATTPNILNGATMNFKNNLTWTQWYIVANASVVVMVMMAQLQYPTLLDAWTQMKLTHMVMVVTITKSSHNSAIMNFSKHPTWTQCKIAAYAKMEMIQHLA